MPNLEQGEGWRSRRALAATIRVAVTLVPVAASLAVGLVANQLLPVATTIPGAITRSAGILLSSLPVLVVVDVVARRFLPLAALLQLSLVFPDQTPSRFRLALKAGSGRHMARAVEEARENGLSEIPDEGAEQLVVLATAIGDHDRRTRGHSERVRLYAELIGESLDLSAEERNKLQWAALIHDIGKVTVPPEILNKKGKPDEAEWAILQAHPAAGEQLVGGVEGWLGEWVHAVGGHHEKWDGSGYPRGLAGADIPRAAAIVAVADSFEVMTAVRSYKKAMTLADARREMTRCAGKHFSPEVVRAFLNLSIGDLRRSMGLLAAVAHLPVLGRLSTAASYAPDTISTAVSMTSSAATAGAGAVAVTASVAVATTSMAPAPVPAAPAPVIAQMVADTAVVAPVDVDLTDAERHDEYQSAAVVPASETPAEDSIAPVEEPAAETERDAPEPASSLARSTRTARETIDPAWTAPASTEAHADERPATASAVAVVASEAVTDDAPAAELHTAPATSQRDTRGSRSAAAPDTGESNGNGNGGDNGNPDDASTPVPSGGDGSAARGDVGPGSDHGNANGKEADAGGSGNAGGNGNGHAHVSSDGADGNGVGRGRDK